MQSLTSTIDAQKEEIATQQTTIKSLERENDSLQERLDQADRDKATAILALETRLSQLAATASLKENFHKEELQRVRWGFIACYVSTCATPSPPCLNGPPPQ